MADTGGFNYFKQTLSNINEASKQFDQFNTVPRCVVSIGSDFVEGNSTATIPLSYDLVTNPFLESDTLTLTFPTDLFNIIYLHENIQGQGKIMLVELWTGYENANETQHVFTQSYKSTSSNKYLSNDDLKKKLLREYKKRLNLRWFGVVDSWEQTFNSQGVDITIVNCKEITSTLENYIYEKQYKGDNARLKNVLSDLNKNLKYFKFKLDPKLDNSEIANLYLGTSRDIDEEKAEAEAKAEAEGKETRKRKEYEYTTTDKTYWDIIQEIAKRGKLKLIKGVNPFEYEFRIDANNANLWLLDRYKHWTKLSIRSGSVNGNAKSTAFIILASKQKNGSYLTGSYPSVIRKKANPEDIVYVQKYVENGLTQKELDKRAFQYAKQISSFLISGDIDIPSPLTGIQPNDLIEIKDSTDLVEQRKIYNVSEVSDTDSTIANLKFRVTSINESFNQTNGFKQRLEFVLEESAYTLSPDGKLLPIDKFPKVAGNTESNNTSDQFRGTKASGGIGDSSIKR